MDKPNPDNRSDNIEKLQSMVQHTIENMEEAEAAMAFSNEDEQARIKEKNERRRDSIESFRNEIRDEYQEQHSNSNKK
ncbi:small acid-soluble spore protein Tlp [Mesobacillus harenae]|uniref:small acid-soluble spore protein Tlp n=1 Tax=Mesobacillus harenae TaxID=2213203 RepID=UPI0015805821|nr:small acid-soluble spore protein Tlp [Mesobacillus harenae]